MKTWQKITLIVIVLVGVMISVKSCIDRKSPDLTIAYIGGDFVNFEVFENRNFKDILDDINSDGEVCVDIIEISFNEELGQADKQNSSQKLANALGMGVARVYLLEEKYVIANASAGVFEDLSIFGEGFKNADGKTVAIKISDRNKIKEMGIDTDTELYAAVRCISEIDRATDSEIDKKHSEAMKFAEYILMN